MRPAVAVDKDLIRKVWQLSLSVGKHGAQKRRLEDMALPDGILQLLHGPDNTASAY